MMNGSGGSEPFSLCVSAVRTGHGENSHGAKESCVMFEMSRFIGKRADIMMPVNSSVRTVVILRLLGLFGEVEQ
jgi:hypothetical protein